jgi:hypothetical protein
VDLGAVDSIQPMRVRVAVVGSTGGKSLFAQISINTPQPLGSKNRSIRICFGIRAASSNGNLRQFEKSIALVALLFNVLQAGKTVGMKSSEQVWLSDRHDSK